MNQLSNTSRKLHDRACDLVILFMVYFRFSKMVEITRKISQNGSIISVMQKPYRSAYIKLCRKIFKQKISSSASITSRTLLFSLNDL